MAKKDTNDWKYRQFFGDHGQSKLHGIMNVR